MFMTISKKLQAARSKSNLKLKGESKPESFTDAENQLTYAYSKSAAVLMAYLGFKQPNKRRLAHLIPKDRAAWLELLCNLVLRKTSIQYLTDKELKKVIIRARPNLGGPKTAYKRDPDAPACIDWSVPQVLEWLKHAGFPHLVETFKKNQITGVRLISVDCSALNQMGLSNLDEMRAVTAAIRELLGIPRPNGIRALMRIPAYENYLKKRIKNGKTYDLLTFAKYCKEQGFTYAFLRTNKNGNIPCTCEVRIVPAGITDEEDDEGEESDEGERSLQNAPSVEFTVRNLILRDQTVNALIEAIMESVFCEDPEQRQYGRPLKKAFEEELDNVTNGMTREERLAFTAEVIEALMAELLRTAEILRDIEELKKYIKEEVTPERVQELRECADIVLETVMPIAGLVALGDLTLESIFRSDPELEQLVEDVVAEAEEATNSLVPEALAFVDSVLRLAMERLDEMNIPYLTDSELRQAKGLAKDTLSLTQLNEKEYIGFDDDTGMGVQTEKKSMEQDDKALIEFFRSGIFPQSPPATDGDGEEEEEWSDVDKSKVGGEGHNIQTVGAVHTKGKPRGTLTINSSDASSIARSVTPPNTSPPWSAGSQRPDSGGRKSDTADETGDATGSLKGKKVKPGGDDDHGGKGRISLKEAGQLQAPPGTNQTGGKVIRIKLGQNQNQQQQPQQSAGQGQDSNQQKKMIRQTEATTNLQQQSQPRRSEDNSSKSSPPQAAGKADNIQQLQQKRIPNAQELASTQGGDNRMGTRAPPSTRHEASEQKEESSTKSRGAPPTSIQAAAIPAIGSQGQQQKPISEQQQQSQKPQPSNKPQPSFTTIPKIIEPEDETKKTPVNATKNLSQQNITNKPKRHSLAGAAPVDVHPGLRRDNSNTNLRVNSNTNVGMTGTPNAVRKNVGPNAGRKGPLQMRRTASPSAIRRVPSGQKTTPSSEKVKNENAAIYGEKAYEFFTGSRKDPTYIEASQRKAEQERLAERKEEVAEKRKQVESGDKSDISKKIWDDLHKQRATGAASEVHGGDDSMIEKHMITVQARKLEATKGGIVTNVTKEIGASSKEAERHSFGQQQNNKGPKQELQQIRNALVKRRQIAEEWAKEKDSPDPKMSEQEEARLLRITADGIVTDIVQMALTNMLLQAEAGKDTERIMNALKRIKAPAEEKVHGEHDVLLWEPHLPGAGGPKKGGLRKEVTSSAKKKVQVEEAKGSVKPKDDEREVTRL